MKAVVLVGGEGTRLRPLTYATPKPLLPIVNQAFLERQLTWLAQHGVDEVVLSLGYLPDRVRGLLPRRSLRRPEASVHGRGPSPRDCGSHPLRGPWDRGTHHRLQRRRTHHARPRRARCLPRRARRRSDHPPHPGGGSVGLRGRCPPATTVRSWPSSRSPRRVWPPRTGSTPAPTCSSPRCFARIPERLTVSIDANVPAHARGTQPAARDGERCVLDRHRHAREVPAGTHRRDQRHARRSSHAGCPRAPRPGCGCSGNPAIDPDARIEGPALIGDAATVGPERGSRVRWWAAVP